jgi:glucokinase
VLRRVPTGRQFGPDAVLDNIEAVAADLVGECSAAGLDVAGVGVAVPGIVDDTGVGRLSVTMGWRDVPVRLPLEDRLGVPVTVGHDVRTGAVAEATFGAAAGARSSLFVPIGTGLSAAVVIDGVIHPGATFRAGEIGQIFVAPNRTLETVASARAIADQYAAAIGRTAGSVDAREVAALVRDGDPVASGVWSAGVAALAHVLAAAVATLDIEVLVIGGGLGRSGETLTAPLATALAAELPWRELPRIVTARFAADAGFVGAALEAWRLAAGRDVAELAQAIESTAWDRSDEVVG